MKYEQYLAWQAATGKLISAAMGKFAVKEGRNAQVFGQSVGIEVRGAPEAEEPAEPTWEYVIYGTITTEETGEVFGPHLAARIARPSTAVLGDGLFEQNTQVLSLPGLSPALTVTRKVKYFVTTLDRSVISSEGYPKGIFRGGLKLTCEFFESVDGIDVRKEVVQEYTLRVGRNGDSVTLIPPEANKFYYLRIKTAERL
jgi:hypothetical protein